ncbi:YSIRK-type signal peptide-containing protein [Mammaliicoccus fleurettii]|nr:YSIRK-type signal peptide-containing protein [Mammaliicoccus fleurettii]QPA34674.1 YSIRK-type signal peptide-containing protein [Mammaliicoccus fleurettii]
MIHRQQIFSIRKYAIGTSSILLGLTFFISASATASASELKNDLANQDTDVSPQATIDGHISKERLNASQTETKTADTQALGAQAISPTEQAKPQIDKTANSTAKMVSQNDSDSATKARTQPKQITQSKSSQNEQVHTQATSLSAKNAQNTSSLHAPVHHFDVVQAQPTTPSEAPLSHSPKEMRRPQATAAPLSRQNQTATARKTNSSTHPQTTHIVSSLDTLQSQQMKVEVDQNFPAIKQYKLKNGKTIPGQVVDSSQIIVNGEIIKPTVSYKKLNDHTAEYILHAKDDNHAINSDFKFQLSVIDRTIDLKMTDYHSNNPDVIVRSFGFMNQSLVSVNSQQKQAQLQTTKMSTNTMVSGDRLYTIDDKFEPNFSDMMMYGFVSNNQYSAGLWSNAQIGVGGNQDFIRVTATGVQTKEGVSVGLGATPWILQPSLAHQDAKTQGLLPHIKIAIAEDENHDGKIDWQDGAIAYRDIMNNPFKYEEVPDLVGYRIAMNFGSQAQNPFLKTLDGVKKFYLNTDGLGQSILLKGYNSEGHDSGHLDYSHIGERMGGAEDLNTLLSIGAQYGARFGVHINASETYPESKAFNPDLLKKNEDGTYSYGWNWLDQGFNINADYDLTHQRQARFQALKDVVGERLDFIYVDVWGNQQSGDNSAWPSHQLAKEINDLGWRVGVEWGHGMEYDSTFQHWATDIAYGTYENKGINSEVARFIRNHQKDSWVANHAEHSGAADFPLLGGYNMKDFEGWQGRNDFKTYIKNIFDVDVPTKFLQHYKVMRIENGHPVKMTANGRTIEWTPEMTVDLQNNTGDKVTVQRKSNDYENDINNYRSRTILLNGHTVLDGDNYLIPWNWDANGQPLTGSEQKLYHWNKKGGSSSWELPDSWHTNQVILYELTETGRTNMKIIPVTNNHIKLDHIKAETPYVIYQVPQPKQQEVNWSEGMHIKDAGFNSQKLDAWHISGDVEQVGINQSVAHNHLLKIDSPKQKTQLTQQLTDLKPGQRYALYIGVDNRSKSQTQIAVSHQGQVLATNQTQQSIAQNYVKADAHNTSKASETYKDGGSYFQNMYLFFVAPQDGQVDFIISREAGKGATYLDDIRIVENPSILMRDGVFQQDFETVPQGLFPFVVSEVEGVEDNRTHLSEKNAPYTQRGWNHKRVDDVIQGHWSLKVNGQAGKNKMVIQTIPQNFYFEPGKTYEVSFDYESGSDNSYAFAVGHDDISKNRNFKVTPLKNTIDHPHAQRVTFQVTGNENGQTWIGIYSTDVQPDTRGVKDNGQVNFEGTKDFILDNLIIRPIDEVIDNNPSTDNPSHPSGDGSTDNTRLPNKPTGQQIKQEPIGETAQSSSPSHKVTTDQHESTTDNAQSSASTDTEISSAQQKQNGVATISTDPSYVRTSTTISFENHGQVVKHTTQGTNTIIKASADQMRVEQLNAQLPDTGASSKTSTPPLLMVMIGFFTTVLGLHHTRRKKQKQHS